MDIWNKLYEKAEAEYNPTEITPFLYGHQVVAAIESKDGRIYTGFCIESCGGVMDLCAERVALLNMYQDSRQTVVKRVIAFRDSPPEGVKGMPCGGCRELFLQFSPENKDTEVMVDYEKREIITIEELMPNWWGWTRYNQEEN